ncbi:hypothetical protein JTE90_023844 [Oedothorax gibbosus]|uniref:Uncharacterized protein n=1 Tax=Oedothorax gibbosus TaxID=931172 RepID=A0AAV6VKU9_9ARAC|nr:hypothetical protein JTE90_023844 [Oedothorax gibbosus]
MPRNAKRYFKKLPANVRDVKSFSLLYADPERRLGNFTPHQFGGRRCLSGSHSGGAGLHVDADNTRRLTWRLIENARPFTSITAITPALVTFRL